MAKPAFNHIKKHFACEEDGNGEGIKQAKAIVFVSDRTK